MCRRMDVTSRLGAQLHRPDADGNLLACCTCAWRLPESETLQGKKLEKESCSLGARLMTHFPEQFLQLA